MGFIRVGKQDRRQEGDKEEPSAAAANRSNAGVVPDKERERPEKKKQAKDGDFFANAASDAPSAATSTPNASAVGSGSCWSPSAAAAPGGSSGSGVARNQSGLSVNDFISKTKNQQRQGLKPSGPELVAYARYLGIDPVADHDLLWIAVEALEAPLPSDWTEHFDSNDRVFYYNATMRVSSWTHPLEHIYRETYKTIVNFRNSNLTNHDRADKLVSLEFEVKQMYIDVHREISQWTEHSDEQGNLFYFNREERQSTWTDPRPAKCQILFLRMKMLRLLQSSSGRTSGIGDPTKHEHLPRQRLGARSTAATSSANASSVDGTQTTARDEDRASSPKSQESKSDFDTDEECRSRKRKKKKKKKRREQSPVPDEGRHQAAAAPLPRHGTQGMGSSRSESSVSTKPMAHGIADEMLRSPTRDQAVPLGNFDSHEGLSNVGRTKIKAGIRLEPIAAAAAGNQGAGNQGVRNSASVPVLP